MEANRDEATRCLELAKKCIDSGGSKQRAEKLLRTSLSLYETEEATLLLQELASQRHAKKAANATNGAGPSAKSTKSSGSSTSSSASSAATGEGVRNRRKPAQPAEDCGYTPEQKQLVDRICQHPPAAFYEVLGLEKDASDVDIKRAYRKLALQLHPDKNSAPRAEEAFKSISKAFSVLSDPHKRSAYDSSGADPDNRFSSAAEHSEYGQVFTGGDIDPEEIFRAFFGAAMGPGFVFGPMNGHQNPFFATANLHQHMFRAQRQRRNREEEEQTEEEATRRGLSRNLIQLLPFLILFLSNWLIGFLQHPSYPRYMFDQTSNYAHSLKTQRLKIDFFVNKGTWTAFNRDNQRYLSDFYESVETDYWQTTERQCRAERSARDKLVAEARGWGLLKPDTALLKKASSVKLHWCMRYQDLVQRANRAG